MPKLQTIGFFMASALALNLTPGPAILFILSRCLGEGRAAAVVSVFGLAGASIVHAVAAAFGLAALLAYSPPAFVMIKYCGAVYLVYLGISGFRKGGISGLLIPQKPATGPSLLKIYWQGFFYRPVESEAAAVLLFFPAAVR